MNTQLLQQASAWYESKRLGLGLEFMAEIDPQTQNQAACGLVDGYGAGFRVVFAMLGRQNPVAPYWVAS